MASLLFSLRSRHSRNYDKGIWSNRAFEAPARVEYSQWHEFVDAATNIDREQRVGVFVSRNVDV